MKSLRKFIIVMLLMMFTLTSSVYAMDLNEKWLPEKSENMPTIGLSTTFLSKYIWRGWNLGDEPVMQTDSYISWYGVTFDIWTSYTFNKNKDIDGGRYQEFTEVDYSVDYTLNMGDLGEMTGYDIPEAVKPFSISGGYIYYTFPNVDWSDKYFDSQEVYIGGSYDSFLQPSFTWYWDVGHGKGNSEGGGNGSYFEFGIGHTFDVAGEITADVGMTLGYNNEQWTDKSGWSDMVFSGGVNIPVFGYFTITPTIAYSIILDKDTFGDASDSEFYGGVTIGFEY